MAPGARQLSSEQGLRKTSLGLHCSPPSSLLCSLTQVCPSRTLSDVSHFTIPTTSRALGARPLDTPGCLPVWVTCLLHPISAIWLVWMGPLQLEGHRDLAAPRVTGQCLGPLGKASWEKGQA